jgi:cytoskeletal protein CcmA (bactofilin family)
MWKRDESGKPVSQPAAPPLAQTPAPPAPRVVDAPPPGEVMSLGKSVMIKGDLSASEDLTLNGQIEGSINLPEHTLTIGPEAHVRAQIKASIVVILGAVSGNVAASKKVDVRATGSVVGDIASPSIVIADGAQLSGKIQMTGERSRGPHRTA